MRIIFFFFLQKIAKIFRIWEISREAPYTASSTKMGRIARDQTAAVHGEHLFGANICSMQV